MLVTGPTLPRVTHLTLSHVQRMFLNTFHYIGDQSGGRETMTFTVFDWWKVPVTEAEWAALGEGLGPKAEQLYLRDMGVSLAHFGHIAFVIDQHNASSGVKVSDRYTHLGAQSLTPALIAHEMGHVYGAAHARSDAAAGPDEYGDPFCVMGGEGAKFSFAEPTLAIRADLGQVGWRFCQLCSGLFFTGVPGSMGVCTGAMIGGGHLAQGFEFVLPHDLPAGPKEAGWRRCDDCLQLCRPLAGVAGVCPAGSDHSLSGSDFALLRDQPAGSARQPGWRQCGRCAALFFADTPPVGQGKCPAGGGHTVGPANYAVPHPDEHNTVGPGMTAATLLGCGWLTTTGHGADIGAPLRTRPGETVVELQALRGAPGAASVRPAVFAYADGVARERLLVEYRLADGWDRALPVTGAGRAGWVLVHLSTGNPPNVSSLLVAHVPDDPGARVFIPGALAQLTVVGRDEARGTVVVRLASHPLPGIGDLIDKKILPERSGNSPALVSDQRHLVLAWRGESNSQLNLMVSADDGVTWVGKHTSADTTADSPALAVADGKVFIAWTGQGDGNLNIARVELTDTPTPAVAGLRDKVTLTDTSPFRPALAADPHGNLYLAWTGHGPHRLNVMFSTDLGATWNTKQHRVFTHTSDAGPALAQVAGGRMYLAWRGSGNPNLTIGRLDVLLSGPPDDHPVRIEALLDPAVLAETSTHTPALGAEREHLVLGWTGQGEQALNLALPMGSTAAYTKRVFAAETSDAGPALTSHRSRLYVAWRGSGNTDLNVARVRGRGLVIDDFTTGPDQLSAAVGVTETKTQTGVMLGGVRRTSLTNAVSPSGVTSTIGITAAGGLVFGQQPDQYGKVEVAYGFGVDGSVQDLGVDLHADGADRFRITIPHLGSGIVNFNIVVASGGLWASNGVNTGPGVFDLAFADFTGPLGADLSSVTWFVVIIQCSGGLTLARVETTGS
ncbi:hypothetical protein Cme02nite_03800 [Catellatospora methionotrophica]|uniref:Uncharacterized protein n=2 Tax=Catellatospora methionotrophica TaxID=121620 RepID=A0A8J3PD57_9ACTN|nr:hypothetical protein Cme02nite_03800 [Catellatospora methionotrophica]